jgi:orotate phosphoribosyltransferase
MQEYKKEFIKFLIDNKSLKFGEFTLKSGRLSPYFLNTGSLYSGEAIAKLGKFYAQAIMDNVKDEYNVVFGPAYKGIPLAVSCAGALYSEFSVNRKEAKGHGDKGMLVGKQLNGEDKLILIDDVITAGTAIRESIEILDSVGAPKIQAVVVSVDRMERGKGEKSAIQELRELYSISFFPIVSIVEIIEYLESNKDIISEELLGKMYKYREEYGVS